MKKKSKQMKKDFQVLWKVAMDEIEAFSGASRANVRSGLLKLYREAVTRREAVRPEKQRSCAVHVRRQKETGL